MIINVVKVEEGVFYDFEGDVALSEALIADRLARYVGDTKVIGRYVMTDGDVIIDAKCRTEVEFSCDKCLKKVNRAIDYRVAAGFSLQPKEGFSYVYSGNSVCIDEAVAEEFCLALPTRVLCSDDCKGLCPVCGVNLNEKSCGCDTGAGEDTKENPFAGLLDVIKD